MAIAANTPRIFRIAVLIAVVGGGSYAWYRYNNRDTPEKQLQARIRQLEEEKQRLEAQKKHLQEFVKRLTSERRVAQILVKKQVKSGDEIDSTYLMFQEFNRKGEPMLPRFLQPIRGNVIHVDALVIRFDKGFIENDDPLRGHSIVLFYRIYGDKQPPAEGQRLDMPGTAPAFYCDESLSPEAQAFETELWKNFWQLAEDAKYRKEKGVELAQGEGPWFHFYEGYRYTLTVQGGGGLSIRPEPLSAEMRAVLNGE